MVSYYVGVDVVFRALADPTRRALFRTTRSSTSRLSCRMRWPLPTGLGGLIGAGFTNLASLVTGANPQPVTAWLFAIILTAPTLALFWVALGLGAVTLPKMPSPQPKAPKWALAPRICTGPRTAP